MPGDIEVDVLEVHPDLRDLFRMFRQLPPRDSEPSTEELRNPDPDGFFAAELLTAQVELHGVEDVEIPVDGDTIPARLYRPEPGARRPGHVHFHGGGFVMGSVNSSDLSMRLLAKATDTNLLSVGYRLAPEHPWPTAAEDAYAAACWAADHADELGIDASDLSVGGDSAGCNLAAVVCLMAIDRDGPSIVAQMLNFGAYDLTVPETASLARFGDGFGLDRPDMVRSRQLYLNGADGTDRYASPLLTDVTGAPPAVLMCGTCDPLYDHSVAYAEHLRRADVPVRLISCDGHLHGTMTFTAVSASARDHIADLAKTLAELRPRR